MMGMKVQGIIRVVLGREPYVPVSPLVLLHSLVPIVMALVQTSKHHELLGPVSIPKNGITNLIS